MLGANQLVLHRAVAAGEFRRMALLRVLDIVRALVLQVDSQVGFEARQKTTLIQFRSSQELIGQIEEEIQNLRKRAGNATIFVDRSDSGKKKPYDVVEKAMTPVLLVLVDTNHSGSNGLLLLDAFNRVLSVEERFCGNIDSKDSDMCRTTADESHIYFYVTNEYLERVVSWEKFRVEDTNFVASVAELIEEVRRGGRKPSKSEAAVIQAAYDVLAKGVAVASPYRSLGVPGFKEAQTLLMLTDPGEGHLRVTCSDPNILSKPGVAVHIEHIDREEAADKERIEPYRLPAPINAAKVRLHVGAAAPCTAYIGRPVFENRRTSDDKEYYKLDRLKSAHMTAGACTSMFLNGIAECKIGIERMTANESVDFMKAVVGNVFRDVHRQYLSAAFNVFTPIINDRNASPFSVKDSEKICNLSIQLTEEGGFDKVTWDGAESGVFPTEPIIARNTEPILTHEFWVKIVHQAHLAGLTTYVSGGLEPQHMPRAVYCSLDGLGIGVKLHYYNPETRQMGDLKPDTMKAVLETAASARLTQLGKAAKVLARLARLHFEGILSEGDDKRREELLGILSQYDPPPALNPKELEKMPETKANQLIEEVIAKLIKDGNESITAINAQKVMDELKFINEELQDDLPLMSPIVGREYRAQLYRSSHPQTITSGTAKSGSARSRQFKPERRDMQPQKTSGGDRSNALDEFSLSELRDLERMLRIRPAKQ